MRSDANDDISWALINFREFEDEKTNCISMRAAVSDADVVVERL